jgi:hypothetical protein
MPLQSLSLRRFVRRALVDTAGVAEPDRTQLASAFETLCRRLRDQLKPLFGSNAVEALFVRSVHITASEHAWLGGLVPHGKDACSVDRIASLEHLDLNTLQEGFAAVLAHNIGLLSAFIGEDLVMPLVQQAWGVSGASGSQGHQ